jgi:hypothetical protein
VSFIGGGSRNTTCCYNSTISGGYTNSAIQSYSTISGGYGNTASAKYSTISGGRANTASGDYSFVGGGYNNTASGYNSSVVSGINNVASGFNSTISGGYNNKTCGTESFVGGGGSNTASAAYSGVFGLNVCNTTACSFMSNQLIACNIFGATALCANASGVIVPVVSDERLKTNICSLACGIDRVSLLNPVTYNWIDEKNGKGGQIGFIAQEVEKVVPSAVFKTTDGDYGFNDRPLVALLTKTVQEQEVRIQEQEVRITKLEKLVQELMAK